MFDLPSPPAMQRSKGRAFAAFTLRQGAPHLADLAQQGSAKLMLPRVAGPVPEAVFLNTSGGLTGGDLLSYGLQVGAGVHLCATTQTAERAYRAEGPAEARFAATVGAGGRLDWLPQETILFQSSNLSRRTEIDLAHDATALLCESVVLGRLAMGEVVTQTRLTDHRMIRRDGRPVWAEMLALDPEVLARAANPVLLDGALAFGVAALVMQGAEDAAAALRALPAVAGAGLAVSGWDGRCLARVLAPDGLTLRKAMAQIIKTLSARPLPRVWASGGLS
ncbi:urease accessory protein UreD [bacterium]|nr:urease accessory protein UreD [bacterium]